MPFTLPRRSTAASGPRRTYRQPAMLAPGIVLAVACAAFVVLILLDSGLSKPAQLLWPLAGLLLIWVVFLRPCLQLTQAGVVMRNLVRDVRGGWPAIDLIEQRWNLKVYDAHGKGYGSWAITAQRPRRVNTRRGLHSGPGMGKIDLENPTASVMEARPGSAAGVAAAIRTGQEDYTRAVQHDPSLQAQDELVASPAWPAIAALALAVIFVLVAVSV
ncbi:hypothetical protein [Flexivirga sp.]|uniref:hypothetical protein n=1 Tax=Flexivirga sp. TaxID=1962927 RepID=UPI003F802986